MVFSRNRCACLKNKSDEEALQLFETWAETFIELQTEFSGSNNVELIVVPSLDLLSENPERFLVQHTHFLSRSSFTYNFNARFMHNFLFNLFRDYLLFAAPSILPF